MRLVLRVLFFGIAIAVGWPLLFWLAQKQDGYRCWLGAIVIPWWILIAVHGLRLVLMRAQDVEPRA